MASLARSPFEAFQDWHYLYEQSESEQRKNQPNVPCYTFSIPKTRISLDNIGHACMFYLMHALFISRVKNPPFKVYTDQICKDDEEAFYLQQTFSIFDREKFQNIAINIIGRVELFLNRSCSWKEFIFFVKGAIDENAIDQDNSKYNIDSTTETLATFLFSTFKAINVFKHYLQEEIGFLNGLIDKENLRRRLFWHMHNRADKSPSIKVNNETVKAMSDRVEALNNLIEQLERLDAREDNCDEGATFLTFLLSHRENLYANAIELYRMLIRFYYDNLTCMKDPSSITMDTFFVELKSFIDFLVNSNHPEAHFFWQNLSYLKADWLHRLKTYMDQHDNFKHSLIGTFDLPIEEKDDTQKIIAYMMLYNIIGPANLGYISVPLDISEQYNWQELKNTLGNPKDNLTIPFYPLDIAIFTLGDSSFIDEDRYALQQDMMIHLAQERFEIHSAMDSGTIDKFHRRQGAFLKYVTIKDDDMWSKFFVLTAHSEFFIKNLKSIRQRFSQKEKEIFDFMAAFFFCGKDSHFFFREDDIADHFTMVNLPKSTFGYTTARYATTNNKRCLSSFPLPSSGESSSSHEKEEVYYYASDGSYLECDAAE